MVMNDVQLETPEERLEDSKRKRHLLTRAVSVALVVLVALFVATVLFRITNPISPIAVAEMLGASRTKRAWLPLEKISPDLPLAVIAKPRGETPEFPPGT
jgi:hypothetical protein